MFGQDEKNEGYYTLYATSYNVLAERVEDILRDEYEYKIIRNYMKKSRNCKKLSRAYSRREVHFCETAIKHATLFFPGILDPSLHFPAHFSSFRHLFCVKGKSPLKLLGLHIHKEEILVFQNKIMHIKYGIRACAYENTIIEDSWYIKTLCLGKIKISETVEKVIQISQKNQDTEILFQGEKIMYYQYSRGASCSYTLAESGAFHCVIIFEGTPPRVISDEKMPISISDKIFITSYFPEFLLDYREILGKYIECKRTLDYYLQKEKATEK